MQIRPLHDRVLAKRVPEVAKTSGGLFIPDNAKEKPLEAEDFKQYNLGFWLDSSAAPFVFSR